MQDLNMARYLQKRRRRWYAVMEIPSDLKKVFGKPRFVQSLQTESLSEAERRVHSVVAKWKKLIHLKRSGKPIGDAVKAMELQQAEMRAEGYSDGEIKAHQEDLAYEFQDDELLTATKVVHGEWVRLDRHIDDYLDTLEVTDKTEDMQRSDLKRFAAKFELPEDATRKSVADWVMTDLMGEKKLSHKTCRRIISACRGYWRWLQDNQGVEGAAPFDGVVPQARRKTSKQAVSERRKGFGRGDYQKLLEGAQRGDEALSALIRLAAYTGCRIEELCSLKLEQITDQAIEIRDAKTEAGWRTVPIHNHIADLVAELADASDDGFLLSGLSFNKYGDRSNAIGKRFGRLKKSLGYGPDYVFHSFRKGVATQLESAGVPENISARLLGHDLKTMSYGLYSGGVGFPVLKDAIESLDWRNEQRT